MGEKLITDFKIGDFVKDKKTHIIYEVLGKSVVDGIHLHPVEGGHHVWIQKGRLERI